MQKGPLWGGGQSHLAVPWTSLHTPLFLQGFGKQISRSEVEETKKLGVKQKNEKRRSRTAYSTACFCLLTRIFVLVSLINFCTYMYTSLPSLKKNIGRSLNLYHSSVSNTIYFSATTKVFSQSGMFLPSILLHKQNWPVLPVHFSPLYPSSQMHLKPFSVSTQVAWWEQGLGLQKFWSKNWRISLVL